MNSVSFLGFAKKFFNPLVVITRGRGYYAEKIEKGPLIRRYGYKDDIIHRGLLPRLSDGAKLPIPTYRSVSSCSF